MEKYSDRIGFGLSLIGILVLLFVSYFGLTHLNTWHDEIFSMWISTLPFNQFWTAVIQDVHPPLYYLIYKFFINVFGLFNVTDLTFIGKFVSLVPIYLLIVFSLVKIRKNFDMLTAGLFIFSLATMPMFIQYSLEVRMYSWSIFFLTTSFIFIYEIIKGNSYKNWIILTLLTICSFYTQYFSALASVVLYLLFLVYILRDKKELLKTWFASVIVVILAYVPWIPVAYSQFKTGEGGFWIPPITADTVISYVYAVFSPLSGYDLIGVLFLIAIAGLAVYSIKNKRDNFALMGILSFILVPLIGICVSYLFFPIFHKRYLLPLLGVFWLSICILTANLRENKKLFTIFLVIILAVGALSVFGSINNEQNDFEDTVYKNETLQGVVAPGSIVIFDNNVLYLDFGTYFLKNNSHYLFEDNVGENIADLLNNTNHSKVYYIDCISDGYSSNYQECVDSSIKLKEVYSSYPNEYIRDFKIYEVQY